jgi:CHAT domain-containing protein
VAGRKMRLVTLIAAAAIGVACAASPAALDRLYQQAQEEMRRGQVDGALATATQGLARANTAQDAVRAWRFRLLVADVHLTRLEFPAALALLEQQIPESSELAPARGRQLYLLARARIAQGQLGAAAPLIEQAKPLAAGDVALVADLELLESQVLYRSGRATDADALLASARTRVAREGDPYRLAQVSIATGMGLVTRGRYDEALPHFESVIDEREVAGTTVQGLAFNNAGLCHARLGQFAKAVTLQQQAIRIQERGRKQNHAQALGELGSTYLLQEDYARGAEYLQRAFTIAAEAGLASDAALFARNLAGAYAVLARWDEAAHFHQEARRFAERTGTESPYSVVTEARIAAGRGHADEAARLFTQALADPKATPGVRWMSHEGLARLATASGKSVEAARQFESALQIVEQTRSSLLRADDRISFTSRLLAFYRGYVELLLAQKQVERALETADASRARVLAERQGVAAPVARATAAALKQLARTSESALLFYWLGAEQSWLWTVTGDGVSVTALPPASQLEALVTEHQAAIQNALADPLTASGSAGERLYQLLVQPVSAAVARRRSVVIVPDGPLHRLNFETLLVPGSASPGGTTGESSSAPARHFWIDDLTVQIAPSLAMLEPAAAGAAARSSASLLLVGNAPARSPEFPALSYAPAEMAAIQKHFAPTAVSMFDGELASPAAFRSAAPERFAVIHFTSHAVANTESPLDSAVLLSGPDNGYKLYARDVAGLPLKAELVTVSACRSAGERAYAGEGLVGFAWAFLRGGSRRVVAGLWDVDDRSTAALMDELYARIAAGAAPPVALREAKQALIRNGYAKPYYWAPFQMFTIVI